MEEIELIFPAKAHETDASDYLKEHILNGEPELHGDSGLDHAESYDGWLDKIGRDLNSNISSTIFFAVRKRDGKMIGTINVRHPYEGYVQVHGHIGYGVRPSERRKGYATQMLKLALEYCKKIEVDKVLVTCDKSNLASAGTIIKCGGVFESETVQDDSEPLQRYWIDINH